MPKIKMPSGKITTCGQDQVRDLLASGCELVDSPVVTETPEEVAAIMAEVEAEDAAEAAAAEAPAEVEAEDADALDEGDDDD
jgi:hypothetical protein